MLAVVLVAQHWCAGTAGFWDVCAALVHRECHRDHPNEGTLPKKMLFSAQESSGADVCRAV